MVSNKAPLYVFSTRRLLRELVFILLLGVSASVSSAVINCTSGMPGNDCQASQAQAKKLSLVADSGYPEPMGDSVAFSPETSASIQAPANSGGFYVNQARPGDERLSEFLLVILLTTAILSFLLMRAKKLNNK